jgi:predicted tellurium resistance membrane protein TerC
MQLVSLLDIPDFGSSTVWMSLITLTFLEIVLGIDNVIFISIVANKVEASKRALVTRLGLILALVFRVLLLFSVSWLVALTKPWIVFDRSWLTGGFSGQSLVLILGGVFLLYKATTEIGHKLNNPLQDEVSGAGKAAKSFTGVLIQIILIDMVFSFDSILTAVGMTSGLYGALIIMIISVLASILIMLAFAVQVGEFVRKHPAIQMLALSFLILIGFMLIAEGAHSGDLRVFDQEIGTIPKGYLYFAIAFSLGVEFLNMRIRDKQNKKYVLEQIENKKTEGDQTN